MMQFLDILIGWVTGTHLYLVHLLSILWSSTFEQLYTSLVVANLHYVIEAKIYVFLHVIVIFRIYTLESA